MSHKGREMQEITSRGRMKSRPDGISCLRVIGKSRIDLEKLQIGDCPYYLPIIQVLLLVLSMSSVAFSFRTTIDLLNIAIARGDERKVRDILISGANINSFDQYGSAPLHIAASNNRKSICRLLLEKGANVNLIANNSIGASALHEAASRGSMELCQLLVDQGAIVDITSSIGSTPLVYAAREGRNEICKYLISHGADINGKKSGGGSPIFAAAENGKSETFKILLDSGAMIEPGLLERAVSGGEKDIVQILLARGIDINERSKEGDSILHEIAFKIALLEDAPKYNGIPRKEAKIRHQINLCEYLIQNGATVNAKGRLGDTPLHIAAFHGGTDICEILLLYGADPNARNDKGETPLHYAASHGHYDICKILINNRADVKVAGIRGNTALHLAAENGIDKICILLIEKGAGVNAVNADGETPLHNAAYAHQLRNYKYLIGKGADENIKNKNGATPKQIISRS